MQLPVNNTPVFTLTIPSTGKKMKYGPFLVKDEKSLLIAQQTKDLNVMYDTLKSVIKSCAKSPIDVDKLASFDVQYIFTQLRAVSVGEMVDIYMSCPECNTAEAKTLVRVDLNKVQVTDNKEHVSKISLFDDVGIKLNYPNIDTIKKLETLNMNDPDVAIDIICDCIEYIYNTDQIFKPEDTTRENMITFINNLTKKQMNEIRTFFKTMPRIYAEVSFTCPVCNKTFDKRLEGLGSFF